MAGLVLHWPGEFGKYWDYARSAKAGHRPLGQAVRYVLWYWWPGPPWLGLLVIVAATAAALTAAVRLAALTAAIPGRGPAAAIPGRGPAAAIPGRGLPRFLLAAVWVCAVTTAGMIFYAVRGLDNVRSVYVGFFYWSVPLLMFLVTAVGLTAGLRGRRAARLAVAAAVLVALGAGLGSPALRADVHDNEPALVPAMAAVAARAHGRLVVLHTEGTLFDTHGLLVQAVRTGVRACLAGPPQRLFATSQFICDARQAATGALFRLYLRSGGPPPGMSVIARLRYSVLAASQGTSPQAGT